MNYQHIIVPVDGSEISLAAARQAAHIAKAFGSKLTAISLVAVDPFSGVDFYYISPVVKDYFVEARANAEKLSQKLKLYVLKKALMQRLKSSKVKFLQMVF